MVRKVKDKYNLWLVGYYDDFNGARALGNDDNVPDNASVGAFSHLHTHYGNALNGEATLNPRYRWCYYDRTTVDGYPNADEPYMFSLSTNRLLHNKGAFEWLSHDVIRNYPSEPQGRAQIQYPDGHTNTNKFRIHPFGGDDAYQMFCNGHNTLGRYIVPTGDIDSSFGRRDMEGYGNAYHTGTNGKNSWIKDSEMGAGASLDEGITMVRRAHLAGRWMGETFKWDSNTETMPKNVFAPLESPSGMPFLCVQQYNQVGSNSTPSIPSIYYDGTLNSRDTNDILHFRLAVRSFNGGTSSSGKITPKITIKAGYTSGPAAINNGATDMEGGLTGTPAISFDLDLTGYNTNPHLYTGNTTKVAYENDDSWIDVDVHLNYDTGRFNVYQDGNLKATNQSFSGSAEDMYGWAIFMHPTSGDGNVTTTLMLDRVALCRPLTDDPIGRDLPPLDNLRVETTINGYSSCSFQIEDDADNYSDSNYGFSTDNYKHNFTTMFIGNKLADWGAVVFASAGETGSMDTPRIDRPVWRGVIQSIAVKENKSGRRLDIRLMDGLTSLDKAIPMWELGQGKTNDLETFSPYWAYDAEGLIEVMDLGSTTLKQLAANVGRDLSNDYENRLDQRTQLKAGHPIQMYNNEDYYGPNNLEDDFEGAGVEYFYEDSTGIRFVLSGNPNVGASGNIVIDNTGIAAYDERTVAITAHHSIDSTGAIVTYNASHTQEVLTVVKGSGTGQFPFTEQYTNSIAYVGKYLGPSISYDDGNYSFTFSNGKEEQNENYRVFYNTNPATWEEGRGSIAGLTITKRGQGYTVGNNYYTLVGNKKEKKGRLVLPAPIQPDLALYPDWVGVVAQAEWEAESTHIGVGPGTPEADDTSVTWVEGRITDAIVTDGGGGYGVNGMPNLNTIDRIQGTGTYDNDGAASSTAIDTTTGDWPTSNSGHVGLTGTHIVSGNGSHADVPSLNNLFLGYFNVNSGSHSTSGLGLILNFEIVANNNGGYSLADISIVSGGAGYATGDTLVVVLEFLNPGAQQVNFFLTVAATGNDAELEIIPAEQAYSDNLTFYMDTRHNTAFETMITGDEFIISGASSDYDEIRGKHAVKAIKKVLNYHGYPPREGEKERYLWQIQTFTPIPSGFTEGDFGDFNTNYGLLKSDWWNSATNERVAWSKKIKATITPKPASMPEDITSRALHARWMRDLPDSLWFKYHFGRIGYTAQESFSLVSAVEANASSVEITQTTYNAIPNSGVAEIVQAQSSVNFELRKDLRDIFIYKCKYVDNSSGSNKWYLGACEYISLSHPINVSAWGADSQLAAQNTQVNIISHDDNWKHIWLLWADMRNDGTADADGGQRKKSFGLKYPSADNYEFDIQFDDQVDKNGDPQSFAQLKIGEDLDMWEVDSTIDKSTSAPFSRPLDYDNMVGITGNDIGSVGGKLSIAKTGHGLTTSDYVGLINFGVYDGTYKVATVTDTDNFVVDVAYSSGIAGSIIKHFYTKTKGSSIDETYYQDWHEKGGALVVIDTSRFFNLNTIANRGKVGQDGGGQTNLGDYYAVGVGDPVLIDSYYRNAASTTATTDSNYRKHYNLEKMVTSKTELAQNIEKGHFWIEPTDTTIFGNHGVGRILGLTNDSDYRSDYYYLWNGKVEEDVLASAVTVVAPSVGDKFWTITKSGATFISDGVGVGTYVENTSKPLVEGVGDSWVVGWKQKHYYRVKEVVSETQLKIERVIHYEPLSSPNPALSFGSYNTTGEVFSGYSQGIYVKPDGFDADIIADGWASGNHLKIPKQLFNILLDTVNSATTDSIWSPSGIENIFTERLKEIIATKTAFMYAHSTATIDASLFSKVEVYTSTANEYAYRLMMKIDGKYKNTNGGTFYESDKMRVIWSNALLKSWWANTKLSALFDIQNVPISFDMTTYNSNASVDSYGSMVNNAGKAVLATVKTARDTTGIGDDNALFTSFSWLVGRDNRIDFRPKYNSGYTITRDEVMVSSFDMRQMERVDNVRVIYNKGMSITDFPTPNVGDTTTWMVLEHPEITSNIEAISVAKAEYNSRKKNPISLDVEMRRLHEDDTDAMLDGGRYGYIADAQVALQGNDQSLGTAWCWTIMGTGGVPFSGMINGLDGNMGAVVTDSTLHSRYGTSAPVGSGTIEHQNNYTHYGSRSVSKAVQIVHVGKDTPKTSATTGEKLRVVVATKPSQAGTTTIETSQFRVFLLDCAFATTTSSGYGPDLKSGIEGHSSLDVQYNGFYEIDVPSTYGSGKVVFSFNADYCRDLLRSRCGDPTSYPTVLRNSQTQLGDTTSKTVALEGNINTSSIFPLGCRKQTGMKGGFGDVRAMWYAPTLNIVDGLMYVPATYVKYTDAGFDINNKTMVINNVRWRVSHQNGEEVKLALREDESTAAGGILSYIFKPGWNTDKILDPSNSSVVMPPTGGINNEIDPNTPIGGNTPSDNDGYKLGEGVGLSDISRGTYKTLRMSMDSAGSQYSAQYGNALLGQTITPSTPSSMRGMTGALKIHPTQGSASATDNGINLPGKGKEEGVGATTEVKFSKKEIEHRGEVRVQTPTDAINDEINITADLKLPSTTKQGSAVLYVSATCLETGASISEAVHLSTGSNLTNKQLCSTSILEGAGTTGNTIVVTLSRRAGVGNDTALYTTMGVNNLGVNFRRAAFNSENTSNIFMPYS